MADFQVPVGTHSKYRLSLAHAGDNDNSFQAAFEEQLLAGRLFLLGNLKQALSCPDTHPGWLCYASLLY